MGVRSAPACGTPSSSSPPPPWPSPSSRAWDLLPPSSCNLASSPSLASLVSNLSTFPAPRGKWSPSSLTRQARPSPFSSWVSPNSSSSSHSSRGSNQLPSSSSSSGQLPSSSSGQPLSSSNSLGQHLSSSNLHLQQDHSGPLPTSRTHIRAIFRFISKTLPSSSNSLALSRGKPSVSSKPAPLLHARPSRLHLSPSASSQLLSLSGSSLPLSSSSASSQHRALPRGDPRLSGPRLRRPGGRSLGV